MTPEETSFLEWRRWTEQAVTEAHRIPAQFVGGAMSKHTPGPWFATTSVPDPDYWIIYTRDQTRDTLVDDITVIATDMLPADACLAAAAPDLLNEARSAYHELYYLRHAGFGRKVAERASLIDVLDRLAAAIEKATGEKLPLGEES